MESIRELYRTGKGPSSSHTMGPEHASVLFKNKNPDAASYEVRLFGSLSKTGRGHGTDKIIVESFAPKLVSVIFDNSDEDKLPHPNTMELYAYDSMRNEIAFERVFSVGGGAIQIEGEAPIVNEDVYKHASFSEIK